MWYGHKPHTHRETDLTIIKCRACGWISPEMTRTQKAERGFPWYCDDCGARVASFVTFAPEERQRAYEVI
jgi:hypothetical protein